MLNFTNQGNLFKFYQKLLGEDVGVLRLRPTEKNCLIEALKWLLSGEDRGKLDDPVPNENSITWMTVLVDIFVERCERINKEDLGSIFKTVVEWCRSKYEEEGERCEQGIKHISKVTDAEDFANILLSVFIALRPKMDKESKEDLVKEKSEMLATARKIGSLGVKPIKEVRGDEAATAPAPRRTEMTPEQKNNRTVTELYRRLRNGEEWRNYLESAIAAGFDLNYTPANGHNTVGGTLMSVAIENRDDGLLKWLIDHGAGVNNQDYEGRTALQQATFICAEGCIRLLMDHGASPMLGYEKENPISAVSTALTRTSDKRDEILRLLLGKKGYIDFECIRNAERFMDQLNATNDSELIQFMFEHSNILQYLLKSKKTHILEGLIAKNNVNFIKFILEQGRGSDRIIEALADYLASPEREMAKHRDDLIRFMLTEPDIFMRLMRAKPDILSKWLPERRTKFVKDLVGSNNIELIEFILEQGRGRDLVVEALTDYLASPEGKDVTLGEELRNYLIAIGVIKKSGEELKKQWEDTLFEQLNCDRPDISVFEWLAYEGLDFNFGTPYTPLMVAVQNNHLRLVQWLIEHGADVNMRTANSIPVTALDCAVGEKNWECAKILLRHKAEPGMVTHNGAVDYILFITEVLDDDAYGDTLLRYLVTNCDILGRSCDLSPELIDRLIQWLLDGDRVSLLKFILELEHKSSRFKQLLSDYLTKLSRLPRGMSDGMRNLLVKHYPRLALFQGMTSSEQRGPNRELDDNKGSLFNAAVRNQVDVLKRIVDNGVDVFAMDREGFTALYLAVSNGCLEVVRYLLGDPGDARRWAVCLRYREGKDPFELRCDARIKEQLDLAIRRCTISDIYDASRNNRVAVIDELQNRGEDITQEDAHGNTALYLAASNGCFEAVVCLLRGNESAWIEGVSYSMGKDPFNLRCDARIKKELQLAIGRICY